MKTKIVLILIFLLCNKSIAQCTANAGTDAIFCVTLGLDTFYLGGNPSASNGVPPYSYTWVCNFSIVIGSSIFNYTASDFLNDTTVANPYFTNFLPAGITATFYLYVVDSIGSICVDSVSVSFCGYSMFSHVPIHINQGESANLYISLSGDCPPFTCLWSPDYNISDINDCSPLVWPDTTITYTVLITDVSGCQFFDICEVIVGQVNIENNERILHDIILFPNPSNKTVNIKYNVPLHTKSAILNFYDSFGSLISTYDLPIFNDFVQIDLSKNTYGLKMYDFIVDGKIIKSGKLIIKK